MNERRWLILGWAAVAAALAPLGWFRGFAVDWFNHVWLVGHYAATLRETGHFPSLLSAGHVETGWPNFYGFLFYPLLSLPATILGPDLAVRIAAALSVAAVFEAWRRIGRRLAGDGWAPVLCGLAVAVHPYALTNLFNRAALTEFFGYEWFALAVAAAVRWFAQAAWPRPAPPAVIASVFLGLALVAGTHPITIYLGALLLGPVLLAFAFGRGWRPARAQLAWAAAGAVFVAVLGARWAADSHEWKSRIGVSSHQIDYTAKFDGPLQRFAPVPLDPRSWTEDVEHWKKYTPFLEAPLNWMLAVGALAAWWARRRSRAADAAGGGPGAPAWTVATVGGVLGLGVLVSLSPHLYTRNAAIDDAVQAVFHPMQFTYRIVGPLQLVVVLLWLLVARGPGSRTARAWLAVAFVSSLAGVAVKTGVTFATLTTLQRGVIDWAVNDRDAIYARTDRFPGCFYGLRGYARMGEHDAALSTVATVDAELEFARDPRRPWRTADVALEALRGKLVGTNVIAAPFVELVVDGRALHEGELGDPGHRLVFKVPADARSVFATTGPRRHLWLTLLPCLWLAGATGVGVLAWRDRSAQRRTGQGFPSGPSAT